MSVGEVLTGESVPAESVPVESVLTGGPVPLPPDPLDRFGARTPSGPDLPEADDDETIQIEERRRDAYRVG